MVKINSKARVCNVDNVFVFAKQCQQVYYTYIHSYKKDRSRVNWLSIVKTKYKGCVDVVQDRDNELTMEDDVFQLELVDPYRIAPSNNLEEGSNFHIIVNIFVDVNAEELNDVLSFNEHIQVDKEDCDKDEDESIDEEEANFD